MDAPPLNDRNLTNASVHSQTDIYGLFQNLEPRLWILILEMLMFHADSSKEFDDIYIPILMTFPEMNSVPRLKSWRVNKVDEIIVRTDEYEEEYWVVACTTEQYYEDYAKDQIMLKNLRYKVAELSRKAKRKFTTKTSSGTNSDKNP